MLQIASIFSVFLLASLCPQTDICAETITENSSSPITIDLRNPIYKNGVLYTSEGGVVQGKDLRIQAREIEYTKKKEEGKEIHRIEAEGNLMIQYKGKVFTGEELHYDFIENRGVVYEGKTFSSLWYVKGEKIELYPDGSYEVENASITASENKESSWDLYASKINALGHDLFIGKNIQFRLFQVPTFWLPYLKLNLKKSGQDPIIRYTVNWDKKQGPRAAIRCQLYSWRDFSLFGRVEYRWSTGWGGAIETEYFPPESKTSFVTRNYVGTDRLETAPNKQFRFRLQGAHYWSNQSGKTHTTLMWDKYSDVRMPSDFPSEDFEVGTPKQTLFSLRHQEPFLKLNFKARPRINSFESIKEDFSTLYLQMLPRQLGSSGVLCFSHMKASYLDFAYSDQLASAPPLEPPHDYRSGRIELQEHLQRPFYFGPLTINPHVGGIEIFYTNSPSKQPKTLATLTYGIDVSARGHRNYEHSSHTLIPYAKFLAFTKPTTEPQERYIFSFQDGYYQLHQIHAGVRNLIFPHRNPNKGPLFSSDLYANAFFAESTIPQCIPRLYLLLKWRFASWDLSWHNAWNFRNHVLDFSNARTRVTVNENVALTFEFRYRSRYDWRKADHENFFLDVARSESELLASPLSDRRITLLADLFIRFSPLWECHIQSHSGFYRLNERPYNEFKIDLFTWVASSLKLRISYSHTDKDDRVMGGISLVKK